MKKLNCRQVIERVSELASQGYEVKVFDNMPRLRYDYLCYKLVGRKMDSRINSVKYMDFTPMLEEMSPEVAEEYQRLNKQIGELNREKHNLLINFWRTTWPKK